MSNGGRTEASVCDHSSHSGIKARYHSVVRHPSVRRVTPVRGLHITIRGVCGEDWKLQTQILCNLTWKCNKLCERPPQYAPAPRKLTFDLLTLKVVTSDVGYLCAKFSLPRPLCSRLRPDVRDRQTSDVRHASSLNASALWGLNHSKLRVYFVVTHASFGMSMQSTLGCVKSFQCAPFPVINADYVVD